MLDGDKNNRGREMEPTSPVNPMNYTNGHPGKTYHLHVSVVGVISHFVIGLDLRPAPQAESHT